MNETSSLKVCQCSSGPVSYRERERRVRESSPDKLFAYGAGLARNPRVNPSPPTSGYDTVGKPNKSALRLSESSGSSELERFRRAIGAAVNASAAASAPFSEEYALPSKNFYSPECSLSGKGFQINFSNAFENPYNCIETRITRRAHGF